MIYNPGHGLSWGMFEVHSSRIYIPLLLGWVTYKCQLESADWWWFSVLLNPCWLSIGSIRYWKKSVEIFGYLCRFAYFSFQYCCLWPFVFSSVFWCILRVVMSSCWLNPLSLQNCVSNIFPVQLGFLLFFMCWVILDSILDILNITWSPGSCLNSIETMMFLFYGKLSWFRFRKWFEPTFCGL